MKKRVCMLMTVVMTVSVLALAGCGGGGSKTAETKAVEETAAVTEAATEAATEAETEAVTEPEIEAPTEAEDFEAADYTTIREYLEDPEVQPQIEEIEKTNSNDQITMEVLADGDNTLFYKCTFVDEYTAEEAESLKAALEGAVGEDMEEQMLDVKKTIEGASHITGLQIKMGYYLLDGTVLLERVYGGE